MIRKPGGDREMVDILALVLQHDEQAVLTAVELALAEGVATKTHVLNLLHRLIDGKVVGGPPLGTPQALALRYGYAAASAVPCAAVAVLAKAPVPGLAKTRLAPALGLAGAARAQRRFTLDTLHCARAAALGPINLWCAPDAQHRFFRAVRGQVDTCLAQRVGDLGARMGQAFQIHFDKHPYLPLLLVGTDCPTLAPGHLQQAARALQDHDVVLIPAEDGGYVLIGMRRWVPQALQNITWSTNQVLLQTRQQLRVSGASWTELDALWDVDEPADWERLQRWLGSCTVRD